MKNLLIKWLSGTATWGEEKKLRKSAKKDDFLAEAMQGYDAFPTSEHHLTINRLKGRLTQAEKKQRNFGFYFTRIAGAVAVIALISTLIFTNNSLKQSNSISKTIGTNSKSPTTESLADEASSKPSLEPQVLNTPKLVDKPEETVPSTKHSVEEKTSKKKSNTAHSPTPNKVNEADKPATFEAEELIVASESQPIEEQDISLSEENPVEAPPINPLGAEANPVEESVVDAPPLFPEPSVSYAESEPTFDDSPPTTSLPSSRSRKSNSVKTNFYVGAVYNEDGQPMYNAKIIAPNSQTKAATATTGTFVLKSAQPLNQLTVTKEGFHSRKIELNQYSDYLNIVLLQKSTKVADADLATIAPRPVEGLAVFESYLKSNIRYPETAIEKGIEREVEVKFFIDNSGTPTKLKVKVPDKYGFDKEAIRLLKEGPKWQPINSHAKYYVSFDLE